jgi:tRNA A37 threonylcarbamoyladenosine dehydratase
MKKQPKTAVHFVDKSLLQPYNPVPVNLIGAGGSGSQMLTALARINYSLNQLDHPGLYVRIFDDDVVTPANQGRQLFCDAEVGQCKSSALINRVNRFFRHQLESRRRAIQYGNHTSYPRLQRSRFNHWLCGYGSSTF